MTVPKEQLRDRAVLRDRARMLRQQGLTYTEICAQLGAVPKSTLACWFKDIQLSIEQQARVRDKILASGARGRPLARLVHERRLDQWRADIEASVAPLAMLPFHRPALGRLICGILYLCEGGKYPSSRHLTFGNSDPTIVRAFLTLLRRHYPIDERKLRARVMHRWDQKGYELIQFWSGVTSISPAQFYPSYRDKRTRGVPTRRHDYKGVCAIQYGSTDLQYELQATGQMVMNAQR